MEPGDVPLVVAQDQGLQLAQPGAGFDPEVLDELPAGGAVRGERVGLPIRPVQRGHQQRPQPFPERVARGQLGERADHRGRVGVDLGGQVGLHRCQPPFDQPGHRAGQAWHSQPGERVPGPLGQRRAGVARVDVALEPDGVDGVGRHVQPVRGTARLTDSAPSPLRSRVTYDCRVRSAVRGGSVPHTSSTNRQTGTALPGDRASAASSDPRIRRVYLGL